MANGIETVLKRTTRNWPCIQFDAKHSCSGRDTVSNDIRFSIRHFAKFMSDSSIRLFLCLAQRYIVHRARQEVNTHCTILVIFVCRTLESAVGELAEFMDHLVTIH